MNLFGTVLTYTAPSANYRGESLTNRSVIQKITKGRFEYAIISPEAMRNAIRETLAEMNLPCNRMRLPDEEQLAVKFEDYPDADKYIDDFFMGWLIAVKGDEKQDHDLINKPEKLADEAKKKIDAGNGHRLTRQEILASLKINGRETKAFRFRQDTILRMNMAVALEPYRHDSVFTQSPQNVDSPWKNAEKSQLLHRETTVTAFQYPFALNLDDCAGKAEWTKKLLEAIGQLNNVAGNHARSYFEMAPASIVIRLTNQLVAGYDTYGFRIADKAGVHELPEVIDGILNNDYPGAEFYIGGKIVKEMSAEKQEKLKETGAHTDRSPQNLLETVGEKAFPAK